MNSKWTARSGFRSQAANTGPEFVMANGQRVTRSVGFAIVRVNKSFTIDEVVFAEKGDLLLAISFFSRAMPIFSSMAPDIHVNSLPVSSRMRRMIMPLDRSTEFSIRHPMEKVPMARELYPFVCVPTG